MFNRVDSYHLTKVRGPMCITDCCIVLSPKNFAFHVRKALLSALVSRTPRHIRGCIICSKLHSSRRRERLYASVRLQGGHSVHPGRAPLNHLHISDCAGVCVFILPDGPQSHCGKLSFPRCRQSPKYASAHTLRGYYYYYYYY